MWLGQFPATCGICRVRPWCRLGSSTVLVRTLEAYKSWKAEGRGGSAGRDGKDVVPLLVPGWLALRELSSGMPFSASASASGADDLARSRLERRAWSSEGNEGGWLSLLGASASGADAESDE